MTPSIENVTRLQLENESLKLQLEQEKIRASQNITDSEYNERSKRVIKMDLLIESISDSPKKSETPEETYGNFQSQSLLQQKKQSNT